MRNFTIYLNVLEDWISVSDPLGTEYGTQFSTYEETLQESENDQYTLNFTIAGKIIDQEKYVFNPLLQFYFIGAKMYLIMDDQEKRIDFVIKNIAPETNNRGTIYKITAQDEVSYSWAKHNVGYSYKTENSEGITTPKSIFQIAREILDDNYLQDWKITTQSVDAALEKEKIVLDISNSNPYNALIEACNTANASMLVNFFTKTLDFYRKDMVAYSGYRYHPERNLIDYSASYDGEEMTTILHVSGGTDENNRQVTIIPSMPEALRRYFYYNGTQDGKDEDIDWDSVLGFENWEEIVGFGCKKCKINYFLEAYFPLRCPERKKVLLK